MLVLNSANGGNGENKSLLEMPGLDINYDSLSLRARWVQRFQEFLTTMVVDVNNPPPTFAITIVT